MAIKAVELVRKIRDKQYEETKGLSVEEQIKFVREKAKRLQGTLPKKPPSRSNERVRKSA